ncbi:hypothetical protein ANCCAN_15465 [Ancylostoma caninum]|uniref:Nuclear receptor domain-containing protein n=1 Tax=Ancylostoma caninum TaxID=29170 RepID=A0A368G4K7_ANCCA|nr:hypothetical protein ANCCAN_15465 [Ancylostoma caninum]
MQGYMLYQPSRAVQSCGGNPQNIEDSSHLIAQPTPIRPRPSVDGLTLYQSPLQSHGAIMSDPFEESRQCRKLVHQVNDVDCPTLCGICNDRSSGMHYGIYTCEG